MVCARGEGRAGAYARSELWLRCEAGGRMAPRDVDEVRGRGALCDAGVPGSLRSTVRLLSLSSVLATSNEAPGEGVSGESLSSLLRGEGTGAKLTLFCERDAMGWWGRERLDATLGVLCPTFFSAERRRGYCSHAMRRISKYDSVQGEGYITSFRLCLSINFPHQIHPPTAANARNTPPSRPPTMAPIGMDVEFEEEDGDNDVGAPLLAKTVVVTTSCVARGMPAKSGDGGIEGSEVVYKDTDVRGREIGSQCGQGGARARGRKGFNQVLCNIA